MKHNPFKNLKKGEWFLLVVSVAVIALSSFVSGSEGALGTVASVIGVTALIFVAKGDVYGQLLTMVFSVLYGIVSLKFHYYGELITYVGMSLPAAFAIMISWLRHPFRDSDEVEVSHLTPLKFFMMLISSSVVTVAFYFILRALDTPNLLVSTLSVFTSFSACVLLLMRLPYYAVAYAANDVVLITLWVLATVEDIQYLPMVLCFIIFLINDLYGFHNWRKMRRRQQKT